MKKLHIFLILFLFLFQPSFSFAQTTMPTEVEQMTFSELPQESTPSAEQIAAKHAEEYTLPYPGLLPDSPLYFLKTTRDKVISVLISDSLKKADFNLLQADKRLQAGALLIQKDKEKYQLALDTISKGENYFEEAILKVEEAQKQKKDTNDMESRLLRAIHKHQAVITDLHAKAPQDKKEGFAVLLKRLSIMESSVQKLQK